MQIYQTVPYRQEENNQPDPFLTPYLIEGDKNPCALIFPGGAYHGLAQHEGRDYALWFNSIGMSAFVLHYRVYPYAYPCQLLDAQRAVKFIKANAKDFHIDKEKIIMIGSSAGGHLAGMANCFVSQPEKTGDPVDEEDSSVAGLILCYPVVSLTDYAHEGTASALCGEDMALREKLCVHKAAKANMPPLFIWHTMEDSAVDVRNTLLLVAKYRELGLPCEAHIFPHGTHGLGLAKDNATVSQWSKLCENWLKSNNWL